MTDLLALPVTTLDGTATTLGALTDGRAALVVNVASRCGLTPQYSKLEALHAELAERGFTVLGFPCNQFGGQEPGTSEEIAEFCSATYGVTFPMSAKVEVNGPGADPLFSFLTKARKGLFGTAAIKWNFTKFLVGRDGVPIARFAPKDRPTALKGAIDKALAG